MESHRLQHDPIHSHHVPILIGRFNKGTNEVGSYYLVRCISYWHLTHRSMNFASTVHNASGALAQVFLYVCFHFGPHIGFLDLSESFLGTYVSNFLMGSLYSAFSVTRWQYQMWILSCKVMWLAARVQYPFTISKSLSSSLASYHSSISFCS